jgi:RHS repeat-associated protein
MARPVRNDGRRSQSSVSKSWSDLHARLHPIPPRSAQSGHLRHRTRPQIGYDVGGRKLGTYRWEDGQFQFETTNVYFAGKLIRSGDKPVVLDRLGSLRLHGNERLDYFAYGEEKPGATAQNRYKFGTYYRDTTGLDYADQRYYGSGVGRFITPDPFVTTTALANPSSGWNRYAYVENDPVNFRDPKGLFISTGPNLEVDVDFGGAGWSGPDDPWLLFYSGFAPDTPMPWGVPPGDEVGGGGGGGAKIDSATNANARGLLKQRLTNFKDSNCWKVLSHEGVGVQNILDHYDDENFYDVRSGSQFADLTLSDIGISSSDKTTLNAILGSADAKTVGTLGSTSTSAVLLGDQYFFSGNTDAIRMNSLLHELLHALGGFTDLQVLNNSYFLKNGLVDKGYGDTSGITDWLSRDCKK